MSNIDRLKTIKEAIDDIDFILEQKDFKITSVIKDKILKPVIRIAEQFNKLKQENRFEILLNFDEKDLRGISVVRNFIAYNYDSVNN